MRGKPTAPAPYKIESAFPQLRFEKPTSVTEIPGADRLLVTAQKGKVVAFHKEKNVVSTSLVGDLSKLAGGEVSINSATFDPDFRNNHFLYVCLIHPEGGNHSRVARYTLTNAPDLKLIPSSERVIIKWPAGGHSGGCLQFGPDGYLYISTGDGSGPTPPDQLTTGQDITDLLGAVLRIDVHREAAGANYSIPQDNPFVHLENARPEIWAYGLRNPWKFGIDRIAGDVFVADNGWETWEMIHKLHNGINCGWPIVEGRSRLRTEVKRGPTPITPPVKDHPHTEANSVIGGPVYRGKALPNLNGTFVYGDYVTGTIWGLKMGPGGQFEHRTLVDTDLQIVAFAEGSKGEIYVLDYDGTGQVYQLRPSNEVNKSANFPHRLSDTGLFSSTAQLIPSDGVIPYSIVAEPWIDGAIAQRWVAIPGRASIALNATRPTLSEFPNGTVFVKHLALPSSQKQSHIRLETQLLHLENGSWNPYSYLWDADGKDASLVESQGTDHEIFRAADPKFTRTWHVGSVTECRLCHSTTFGVVLGFTGKQLNRTVKVGSEKVNQFKVLTDYLVLSQQPALAAPALVDPLDPSAPIDDRARSYLHTNCGMCHQRGGLSTVSFYAHRDYPFDQLQITKRPEIGSFGIQSPHLISSGDPYSSVILYRISKLGYGRMPYVGSRLVDSRGVALIESWVKSLPAQAASLSGPSQKDSHEQTLLRALTTQTNDKPRAKEIDDLLKTTEGALALVLLMHRKLVSEIDVQYIRESTVRMKGDVRGLLDHFLPEAERRKTLGRNPDLDSLLRLTGDRGRGELIFLSDSARCQSCHDVHDPSKSMGPTLAEIRGKYKQRRELLQHIINPSAQIDEKFTTWTAVTINGQVHSGLLDSSNDHEVQIRSPDKTVVHINRREIEELNKSDRSIMPDGALSDLTPQAAADLLTFLLQSTGNSE